MPKQLEKGTKWPMRPGNLGFDLASAFSCPDQSGGLDWTATDSRLTLRQEWKFMDDNSRMGTTLPTTSCDVREGQYEIEMCVVLSNASGTSESGAIAITNAGGTEVYAQSDAVAIPAGGERTVCIKTVQHFNTVGTNTFCLRAVQLTAGTDITVQPEYVGMVRKIGNVNET